ncbi:hypothetical protein [Salmonella phage vB_SenS_SB13]|uniref:Uncharacterized protein n=1 Tax=Salmonella phage vB_SenS_SB13 TaxID=2591135 RepID=A0A5J6TDG4_9CAUD|nr:hypothetical protein HWC37_gp125 [Salmonella phage vB_SenS_SB13]QFG07709.1 hypothetical protein [Salmonella phage vB_SenS_SB13]
MRVVLIRIQLLKCESISLSFAFRQAGHFLFALRFCANPTSAPTDYVPACMCESDNFW